MPHRNPRCLSKRETGAMERGASLLERFGKLMLPPTPLLRRDAQRTGAALARIVTRHRVCRLRSGE
jgi:hypothetical protein